MSLNNDKPSTRDDFSHPYKSFSRHICSLSNVSHTGNSILKQLNVCVMCVMFPVTLMLVLSHRL